MSSGDAAAFEYRSARGTWVQVFHHQQLACTLRGEAAEKFLRRVGRLRDQEAQQYMARVTGQYRFGNERQARSARQRKHGTD